MTAWFISTDLFDPTSPDRMEDGNVYGGETRLFVLNDDTLNSAIRTLLNATKSQDMRIDRVHKAAAVDEFETDDFPFDLEIEAMAKDAVASGEICVTPNYTFSPYGNNETGLSFGLFEFTRAQPYAGEFNHAASRAASCGDALLAVLDALAADGCALKSIDDFCDACHHDTSVALQPGSLADLIAAKTEGIVWGKVAFQYGNETDD